ncbi:MAG: ABC transporter ATP-binding protein [Bacteroidales bacterium]|nr:ABC transporter ATP-binding protein [Bacteroidales bacterium]
MVDLTNIRFGYSRQRMLFDGLSLHWEAGHICGLLGKNGAGKSTLLKIITGLRFPQEGTAETLGHNACLRKAEALQQMFYLEEEPYIPHLKIKQYEKAYASFYPHFNHEQFQELLAAFEIENSNAYMDKMSLGQKKKVLIAFAIACNTAILLMDEPTNGLDIPSKSIFRRVMAQCSNEGRLTVISTHQVRDLHSLIDHVSILDRGAMLLDADLDEITDKLLFCVKEENETLGEELYSEEGARGTWQVCENPQHLPSSVDLELLFNATICNKTKFRQIFNNQ